MEVKCGFCGKTVEASMSNICPHCGNKLNSAPKKKGLVASLKDCIARFKKAKTVAEWQAAAREALQKKEFVLASIAELHRCEKAEGPAQQQDRSRQPMQQRPNGYQNNMQNNYNNGRMAPPPPRPNQQQRQDTSSLFSIPMPPQNVASRQNNKVPAMSLEKMMDMMRSTN